MTMIIRWSLWLLLCWMVQCSNSEASAPWKKPVQVILLAGQSNMQGMGRLKALLPLMSHQNEYRKALWDDKAHDFKISPHVFIQYGKHYGNLTVGHETRFAGAGQVGFMGVETILGFTLDHGINQKNVPHTPIFLVKVAYGGRDLAIDFRPPSAGKGNYSDPFHGFAATDSAAHSKTVHGKPVCDYGYRYRSMLQDLQQALHNIGNVIPGYNNSHVGYHLAGMVWLQGMSDIVDEAKTREYASNLRHLIRDVRHDLHAPQLPVVVAEVGNHGTLDMMHRRNRPQDEIQRVEYFRSSVQDLLEQKPELEHTTRYVKTAHYAMGFDDAQQPHVSHYDKYFHYYGRPEPYFHIGQQLGRALLELLSPATNQKKKNMQSSNKGKQSLNRQQEERKAARQEHGRQQQSLSPQKKTTAVLNFSVGPGTMPSLHGTFHLQDAPIISG